ncbi:2OG-Fe(II) oxygenase [Methylovirgula sp. 4M-Z18]|uniref:2OG-Fe(II) oxygenase n=1 Tax=Methylovirgula sp. 4M-Z18 TaxID=2293567 RepID=UPI000E2EC6EE|nr:2OG-Fe(II) oxygenase [Methylovirgula sp. 4M-Z18]RFB81396.1 2OG-Fe(II) oxygenase [Methylovirgula sp. 4M-Z18]
MTASAQDVVKTFRQSLDARAAFEVPYRHYTISRALPADVITELNTLPFKAPGLEGVSGRRELHNNTRSYFDVANMAKYPVMRAVADAFQDQSIVNYIAERFEAPIDDTFLRLEYAMDIDGFWLEPHTDLGVKKFTCLLYLSDEAGHEDLGTDMYVSKEQHFGRAPFVPGNAMIFVPSDNTWHGFEKRAINGVRKSVILNYVTHEWKAREQLSFPEAPVRVG